MVRPLTIKPWRNWHNLTRQAPTRRPCPIDEIHPELTRRRLGRDAHHPSLRGQKWDRRRSRFFRERQQFCVHCPSDHRLGRENADDAPKAQAHAHGADNLRRCLGKQSDECRSHTSGEESRQSGVLGALPAVVEVSYRDAEGGDSRGRVAAFVASRGTGVVVHVDRRYVAY